MSFFDFSDPSSNGPLLGLLSGLGQAAMPSRMPVPFASVLGNAASGLMAGQHAQQEYQKNRLGLQQGQLGMIPQLMQTDAYLKMTGHPEGISGFLKGAGMSLPMPGLGSPGASPSSNAPQTNDVQPGTAGTPVALAKGKLGPGLPPGLTPEQAALAGPQGLSSLITEYSKPADLRENQERTYYDWQTGTQQPLLKNTNQQHQITDADRQRLGLRPGDIGTIDQAGKVTLTQHDPSWAGDTARLEAEGKLPSEQKLKEVPLTPQQVQQQEDIRRATQVLSPEAYKQRIGIAGATATARQEATNAVNNPVSPTGRAVGTLGSQTIDVTAPGYSTAPIKEAGGLTQSAIDQSALLLATTHQMPPMGLGSTGVAGMRRVAIQNRAAELDPGGNLAANAAQVHALQGSLLQQTKYADQVERSVGNAENGFSQVVTTFKGKVNNSQLPIINAITNAGKYQLSPGDIAAFHAGLTEVANEYSNVFSRGGQVTDAVRNRAAQIANGNLSIDDLTKVMDELHSQGDIITSGARGQAQKIQGQFNDLLSGRPAQQAAPQQQGANAPQQVPKFTPQDIQNAAIKSGRTVDQVKQELRAKGIQVQ